MTGVRWRRLGMLASAVVLPATLVLGAQVASFADDGPQTTVSVKGTICWEKGRTAGDRPTIKVYLSEQVKHPVTVVLDSWDGTAVAPDDYLAVRGLEVTVPANTSSVDVPITIVADKLVEPDEWFKVTISKVSGAVVGTASDAVTIKDGSPPVVGK